MSQIILPVRLSRLIAPTFWTVMDTDWGSMVQMCNFTLTFGRQTTEKMPEQPLRYKFGSWNRFEITRESLD